MAKGAQHRANSKTMEQVYRVYRLDETTRDAIKEAKASSGQSLAVYIAKAVEDKLPSLVDALAALRIEPHRGETRPARWPMSERTLLALRYGSEQTGVDACALLLACLRRASGEKVEAPKKRRGGRRKAAK